MKPTLVAAIADLRAGIEHFREAVAGACGWNCDLCKQRRDAVKGMTAAVDEIERELEASER